MRCENRVGGSLNALDLLQWQSNISPFENSNISQAAGKKSFLIYPACLLGRSFISGQAGQIIGFTWPHRYVVTFQDLR